MDALIGVIFGVIATSNLVQGAWISTLPWLNLTTAGLVLAVPAVLVSLRQRLVPSAVAALLLLTAAITLGFLEGALASAAADKRTSLVISVLLVTAASAVCLASARRLRWFFTTIVAFAAVALLGQVLVPDPVFLAAGRRTPVGLNSIGVGRVLGAALVICIGRALAAGPRKRTLLLIASAPLAVGLIFAGSRGPVLGAAVAIAALVVLAPELRSRTKVMIGVLGLAASAVAYQLLARGGSRIVAGTDSGRTELYRDAIGIAERYPFGIGWGNYFRYAQASLGSVEQGDYQYTHNIILEFLIETGSLGVLCFVIFCLIVLRLGASVRSTPSGRVLCALALSVFIGALLSSDVVGNRMMWVAFAAILGMAAHPLTTQPSTESPAPTTSRGTRRSRHLRFPPTRPRQSQGRSS